MATRISHPLAGAACGAALVLLTACAGPGPSTSRPPPWAEGAAEGATEASAPAKVPAEPADTTAEADEPEVDTPKPEGGREATRQTLREEVDRVLDDWHEAAAAGDRQRYLAHFSPDAVFMGTDATERWDLATFTVYVNEHFKSGSGWAYTPSQRHVILGPDEATAWFDEALDSSGYGALRGTGALRRDGDSWRIAHYSMTFTVPNGIAREVVDIVRRGDG